MSIYGEGLYRCLAEERLVSPSARPEEQLARAPVGAPLSVVRRGSRGGAHRRVDARSRPKSIYAIGKRDHEEMFLVAGRGVRHPDDRAALLQRLRPAAGALEPVHRGRGDLLLAPDERRTRRSSSRTEDRAATSSTCPTSSRRSSRRWSRRAADGSAHRGLEQRPPASTEHRLGRVRHVSRPSRGRERSPRAARRPRVCGRPGRVPLRHRVGRAANRARASGALAPRAYPP